MIEQKEGETEIGVKVHYDNMVSVQQISKILDLNLIPSTEESCYQKIQVFL